MVIGERLRALREERNLSQGHIEKRTGLLRCYISRVEHGRTVPSIETLEKMTRALNVPLYQLFCDDENPPALPNYRALNTPFWGTSGNEARLLEKFRRLLSRAEESDRKLFLKFARKMARHKIKPSQRF
jgi:transcriptional regulator with XRE-family HTH domain